MDKSELTLKIEVRAEGEDVLLYALSQITKSIASGWRSGGETLTGSDTIGTLQWSFGIVEKKK